VQRLRIRYAKRGRARFTSTRDFGRAFERALRRAEIPMAYSSGFTPHPRISYANASPTGAASEAEYLEIGLTQACDADRVREALDAALPPGLDVVEVVVATPGALADLLTGSSWRIQITGVSPVVLTQAVEALLAQHEVVVQRMTKSGLRSFDVRPAIVHLAVADGGLELLTRHQEPLVRPDDVLSALSALVPACAPTEVPILTRLSQGRLDTETGEIVDPFRLS
jgi:radical SAM-linked protein